MDQESDSFVQIDDLEINNFKSEKNKELFRYDSAVYGNGIVIIIIMINKIIDKNNK